LRELFPHDRISVDENANSVIVEGSAGDENAMRGVLAGLDVKSPFARSAQVFPLHQITARDAEGEVRTLFPAARLVPGPGGHAIVVSAGPSDMQQIGALISALDAPPPPPVAAVHAPEASESLRITQASAPALARAVAQAVRGVRVAVSGGSLIISGDPEAVRRAKELAAGLDEPAPRVRYTRLYRVQFYDANSVGDLIKRSFPAIALTIDRELNSVTVFADAAEQRRIADAVDQLNTSPAAGAAPYPVSQPGALSDTFGVGNNAFEVYTLRAALPGVNGAASTSAVDIASTVTQALAVAAPDLRITVVPNANQLIISGSPSSTQVARQLIDQLDVAQKLVVLDTQVLELDESVSKNLGLSFTEPVISTNYSEVTPPNDAAGNAQRLLGLAPLTRTPLSLGLTLNLAIASGHGRVLANPRITTISGRTASIRAGDTISIQTTAGGGAGTVATTQLQTFQTGVTLDITPIVNAGNFISVLLHPTVNSETGLLNGIPQISTRDTQTTVALRADETLIIGGLIQENNTRTETKIPLLGDLPLVGPAFRNAQVDNERNELVITVTPHIIEPGAPQAFSQRGLPAADNPQPLPTLPPTAVLPAERPDYVRSAKTGPTIAPSSGPRPLASPVATPSPAVTPTGPAFDGYTFGTLPASTAANASDALKIYYASIAPSLPWLGKVITVNAVVSDNVQRLSMMYGGGFSVQLSPQTAGHWQAVFPFPPAAAAALASQPSVTLSAMRSDLSSPASVVIPLGGP
jgi:type II secretory pathway component GspD/PulD (secretin)